MADVDKISPVQLQYVTLLTKMFILDFPKARVMSTIGGEFGAKKPFRNLLQKHCAAVHRQFRSDRVSPPGGETTCCRTDNLNGRLVD